MEPRRIGHGEMGVWRLKGFGVVRWREALETLLMLKTQHLSTSLYVSLEPDSRLP